MVSPLIAPLSNYWTDFLGPVKLCDPRFTKHPRYGVQPRRPILTSGIGKFLEFVAATIEHDN
jgi:hypothetical protein